MKKLIPLWVVVPAWLALLSTIDLPLSTVLAQGTAFTYQGRLNLDGAPANGNYDFQFILFTTSQFGFPAAPILTNASVSVNNGLFTTTLDFGAGVFTGTNFWLDVSVRTNSSGAFTDLSPRQPITPAPYAMTAENLAGVVENNTIQDGVSLGTISGGAGNAIQSGASFATVGGGGNNVIQTGADHSTIGGGSGNNILTGAFESFVGGGQNNYIYAHWSAIGGGLFNTIFTNADYSFIGGGYVNQIQTNSSYAIIGGGYNNQIQSAAYSSTIAGGEYNLIQTNASYSMIGGGYFNNIGDAYSVIAGGFQNVIQTNDSASSIGGGEYHTIQSGAFWSTISGGYFNTVETNAFESTIGGGAFNDIQNHAYASTVSGGHQNVIQSESIYSTISGGSQNTIQSNSPGSTISGGVGNAMQPSGPSVIAGGEANFIQTNAYAAAIGGGTGNTNSGLWGTIGGGRQNQIPPPYVYYSTIGGGLNNFNNGNVATIGGGFQNVAGGAYATIPGGISNLASGNFSFAAGQQAQAVHQGAFVWADSSSAAFSSTANDQFLIRANGGVGINNNNPGGASLRAVGNRTGGWGSPVVQFENISGATGSSPALRLVVDGGNAPDGVLNVSDNGTGPIAEFGNGIGFVASIENDGTIKSKGVVLTSDRDAKEHFSPLDAQAVLAKVISLPVTEWNYRDDGSDKKHIGPVAQDFHAAFGLDGADDKHISVVDEGGVALAAIQGLNQKLETEAQAKDAEIQQLKQSVAELKELVLRKSQITAK